MLKPFILFPDDAPLPELLLEKRDVLRLLEFKDWERFGAFCQNLHTHPQSQKILEFCVLQASSSIHKQSLDTIKKCVSPELLSKVSVPSPEDVWWHSVYANDLEQVKEFLQNDSLSADQVRTILHGYLVQSNRESRQIDMVDLLFNQLPPHLSIQEQENMCHFWDMGYGGGVFESGLLEVFATKLDVLVFFKSRTHLGNMLDRGLTVINEEEDIKDEYYETLKNHLAHDVQDCAPTSDVGFFDLLLTKINPHLESYGSQFKLNVLDFFTHACLDDMPILMAQLSKANLQEYLSPLSSPQSSPTRFKIM